MATKTKDIKKATKTTKAKTTKKTVKPEYIVDLTNIKDAGDVYAAFGWAKINRYLTPTEMDAVADDIAAYIVPEMILCDNLRATCCAIEKACCCKQKKPNIFKRIWNWITGKK